MSSLFVLHTVTALFFALVALGVYVLEIHPAGWSRVRTARLLFSLAMFLGQAVAAVMYWLP
jgi:hypothetical protein